VDSETDVLFEVVTPLGFVVRVSVERWRVISTIKHPVMAGHEDEVRETLANPVQVRRSRSDPEVLLFYRGQGSSRWVCAVTKRAADQGFLITAYPTDAIKEGTPIWPK
jgi:hypothetical protein